MKLFNLLILGSLLFLNIISFQEQDDTFSYQKNINYNLKNNNSTTSLQYCFFNERGHQRVFQGLVSRVHWQLSKVNKKGLPKKSLFCFNSGVILSHEHLFWIWTVWPSCKDKEKPPHSLTRNPVLIDKTQLIGLVKIFSFTSNDSQCLWSNSMDRRIERRQKLN